MVKYQTQGLDRIFAALSDPTRRALLAQLTSNDGVSVSALAQPHAVSLPAIMKHLDVLSDAGLITREKRGRTVTCRLNAAPMEDAMHWLARYERFWTATLGRLAAFLEEEKTCQPTPGAPKSPASPSSEESTPPPHGSSVRGPTRKT